MSQLGNNPIPTSSNELIRTPSNKPEVISRDAFENISELKALPLELQEQVRAILAKIEQTYSNSVELKNQKDKFLSGIVSNIDPKDLDLSKDLISVELEQWNNKILKTKEIEVVAKKDEVVAKKDEVVAKKDEVVAKKVTKVEKTGEKTFERAKEYDQAFQKLSQKLTTLSWGKTPAELIPDYASKLARTEQELVKQGQDPKLAEWVLLVSEQENIVKSIESSTGKKLDARDLADLQADFAGLRNMMPVGTFADQTPVNLALANPQVTLEAYTKIKMGFEPPSGLVYSNPKTGEIVSPSALLTGERTVMTRDGNRYREKDGIRIPSPVPNVSEADTLLQNLALNQQELSQRTRITQVMSRVTQGEISEKFPQLWLPQLNTENAEELGKQLTTFFSSPKYREFRENPESKAEREGLEQRLKQLYQSVTTQTDLTKNIKTMEGKRPEDIVRAQVAEQDRTIDSNLTRLSRLGMGVMGQEKYEKVRDTINKQLRLEANPPIEDQESITENQGELLRKALLKLTGMNEAAMYPDGTISPEAKIKLANLDIQTIENTLLAPPDTTTVEPIKK